MYISCIRDFDWKIDVQLLKCIFSIILAAKVVASMKVKWGSVILYVLCLIALADDVEKIIEGTAAYYNYIFAIVISTLFLVEAYMYVKKRRTQEA